MRMTPQIAALLRKRCALEESGANQAVLNEFDWMLKQAGYTPEKLEEPVERQAPAPVTAEPVKPVVPVKRGPGRPKKV
jgi:hypothetical protein